VVPPETVTDSFGTSLTRGTVTERFALEPVSLVRGVAMTTLPPPDRFVLDVRQAREPVRPGTIDWDRQGE
jgi:hypothetical protein